MFRALWGPSLDGAVTHWSVSLPAAIGLEAVMTAALVGTIFAFNAREQLAMWTPLAIVPVITVLVWAGGPATGTSLNPAALGGPALAFGDLRQLWLYFAAPVLGAVAVALLARRAPAARARAPGPGAPHEAPGLASAGGVRDPRRGGGSGIHGVGHASTPPRATRSATSWSTTRSASRAPSRSPACSGAGRHGRSCSPGTPRVLTQQALFNTAWHAGETVARRAYHPGVVTALVLFLPLWVAITRTALREGVLTAGTSRGGVAIAGPMHATVVAQQVYFLSARR